MQAPVAERGGVMKKFMLALSVLFLSGQVAFAGHQVILETVLTGGAVLREPHGIRVFDDGLVEQYNGGATESLATLSLNAMKGIARMVGDVENGDLYPDHSVISDCADPSVTEYRLTNISGEAIVFYRQDLCRDYYLDDHQGMPIKIVLDGFMGLFNSWI